MADILDEFALYPVGLFSFLQGRLQRFSLGTVTGSTVVFCLLVTLQCSNGLLLLLDLLFEVFNLLSQLFYRCHLLLPLLKAHNQRNSRLPNFLAGLQW